MKWILHIDMNCYFASVEQQRNPALRGKAIAVGGKPGSRSVVAAASREAKARGIKTAMPAHEAAALVPDLIFVEPDYPTYQRYSERFFGLLESFSPDLEIYSIDEAFLDLTTLPQSGSQKNTEDRQRWFLRDAGRNAAAICSYLISTAATIKARIRRELGDYLTVSIGIAHGKRLAKLAAESQKPDGLTVLLGDDERPMAEQFQRLGVRAFTRREFYATADIEDLAGIGPRLGRRLRGAGIHTLADMANRTLSELETLVFPYHKELYLIGQGKDPTPVVPYWRAKDEQSIGHQYTLPRDIPVIELPGTIAWLAERVARRMRKGGFVAHKLAVYLRQTDGPGWGSTRKTSTQLESDRDLYHATWELIREAADHPGVGLDWGTPVRMPGLVVSSLVKRINAPTSFLPADAKAQILTAAIDAIKDRFGDRSITSGLSVNVTHHDIPDGRRKRFVPEVGTSNS